MSYLALYRKYRPTKFSEVSGQKYIVDILKNAIKTQNISHAYLFSGPRGTGKTSVAKIFAKSVNCLNSTTGEACGKCDICKALKENDFSLYYMEIKDNENCPSHTWLAYKENNKVKIFESSWKSNMGIKVFNDEKEMIQNYLNQHKKVNNLENSGKVILCKYKPLLHESNSVKKIHLNPNEFMKNMYNIGTIILSDFNKLPIQLSLENLK